MGFYWYSYSGRNWVFFNSIFFSTTPENESNKITPYAFAVILSIVFILPLMSLIVRRFHDAGVSPIWLAVAVSAPLINLVFVYIISSGDIEGYRALAETIFDITALALYDYTIWVSIFSVLIVCCIPSRFSKYLEYPMDDF